MLSVYFVTAVDSADIRMGIWFSYPTGNGPDCGATKRTNIDPPHQRCRRWYVVTHMSQVVTIRPNPRVQGVRVSQNEII